MMQSARSFGIIVPSLLIVILSGLPTRAGAAPEGEIREARQALLQIGVPSLGTEDQRILALSAVQSSVTPASC